jgi:hypothetical protein
MQVPSMMPFKRRAMALLWVTICMLVMVGFVGLALDTGYAVLVGLQLQHAADAGALAGAQIVRSAPSTVKAASVGIANQNTAAGSTLQVQNSDIAIGTFNTGAFTTGGSAPNAVRVTPRRVAGSPGSAVPMFFGGIFGLPTLDMTRTATAMISGTADPAVVILHPSDTCSMDIRGSANLVVLGGPIQVNSNAGSAACVSGTSGVHSESLNITGGTRINGGGLMDTIVNTGVSPIADPLATLPSPTPGPSLGDINVGPGNEVTIDPGTYNSITIRGTLNLNSGIYIIGSGGLLVNSLGVLRSNGGIMLYITGTGAFDASANNVVISLLAPDPSRDTFAGADVYKGITIFQDRNDVKESKLSLAGSISVNGTLYFPNNLFNVSAGGSEAGARLICSELLLTGNGTITIDNRAGRPTDGRPFLVQ